MATRKVPFVCASGITLACFRNLTFRLPRGTGAAGKSRRGTVSTPRYVARSGSRSSSEMKPRSRSSRSRRSPRSCWRRLTLRRSSGPMRPCSSSSCSSVRCWNYMVQRKSIPAHPLSGKHARTGPLPPGRHARAPVLEDGGERLGPREVRLPARVTRGAGVAPDHARDVERAPERRVARDPHRYPGVRAQDGNHLCDRASRARAEVVDLAAPAALEERDVARRHVAHIAEVAHGIEVAGAHDGLLAAYLDARELPGERRAHEGSVL